VLSRAAAAAALRASACRRRAWQRRRLLQRPAGCAAASWQREPWARSPYACAERQPGKRMGGRQGRRRTAAAARCARLDRLLACAAAPARDLANCSRARRTVPRRRPCDALEVALQHVALVLCCKQSACANTDVQGCAVLRHSSRRPRIGRVRWPLRALETRYWQGAS